MVTRNFPPLTGGMERLNHQVLLALQEEFHMALCGPEGSAKYAGDTFCKEFKAIPAWRYVLESAAITLRAGLEFKPDVIYAGSGLAAHAAALASSILHVPMVTYLHGLDIIAPNRIYQTVFLPAIRRSTHVIVNSSNTAELAEAAGIPSSRITVIHPGTSLPVFFTRDAKRALVREQLNLGSRPVLLTVGRLTERKGLVEFIRNCMPPLVNKVPEICLLIVGEPPSQALGKQSRNIPEEIQTAIAELGLKQNIRLLGKIDDDTLSSLYFASDIFVFPVLDLPDDVEGFGMVAIEAAAHGLPTIGFAVGGIPDAVGEGISGHLAPVGDYRKLTDVSIELLSNRVLTPERCRQHAESFTWVRFGENIRSVMKTQRKRQQTT